MLFSKKILVGMASVPLIAVGAVLVGAFEAHVVNVTAQIQDGVLFVPLHEIEFGTVFPQEKLDERFGISLSSSFLNESVGTQYASFVASSSQGLRKNGTPVTVSRSDPTSALGMPETFGGTPDSVTSGTFYALGFGGSITLGFDDFIVNTAGPDVTIFEVTGSSGYPPESVMVEASQDGTTWTTIATSITRDGTADLGSLAWAKFIRLTDRSNPTLFDGRPTADAYDLDAVSATSKAHLGMVGYAVRQKPKCVDDGGNHPQVSENDSGEYFCPDGSTMMPLLCPYLSKHELTDDGDAVENDGIGITAFHGLPGPWNVATTDDTEVLGKLSLMDGDEDDEWNLDLKVPCFVDECAQDWPDFVRTESENADIDFEIYKADPSLATETFGCDIWVEVSSIE